jgi:hypothetical protein
MRSGDLGFRHDAVPNVSQAFWGHYIDADAEKILQVQSQSDEIEQASALIELDQKIDIAVLAVVAPSHGAEDS